jgi:hypothetical protein
MGKDYGRLSEVAHPTKAAAYNSVTLCGARLGLNAAKAEMAEELQNEEARLPDALYRIVWVILDGDKKFIALGITEKDLPLCAKFIELDKHREPDDTSGHTLKTPPA